MNAVVDIKPSDGTTGNVYELRIYRTVLGGAQQYGKDFLEVKEAREKYSPIWGAWTSGNGGAACISRSSMPGWKWSGRI